MPKRTLVILGRKSRLQLMHSVHSCSPFVTDLIPRSWRLKMAWSRHLPTHHAQISVDTDVTPPYDTDVMTSVSPPVTTPSEEDGQGGTMATIYDVARLAGVSPKTVSRVLNGDGPVGPDKREAVQAAMDALGYVPSNAARMMRSARSGLVGLITGAISMAEGSKPTGLPELVIVQGIQQAFSRTQMT